jgi:hypothetical protein
LILNARGLDAFLCVIAEPFNLIVVLSTLADKSPFDLNSDRVLINPESADCPNSVIFVSIEAVGAPPFAVFESQDALATVGFDGFMGT